MSDIRNLQPRLSADLKKINALEPGAVVLDRYGHAWQSARGYGPFGSTYPSGYWYRAYGDDSEVASFEVAQHGPLTVIHGKKSVTRRMQ